MAQIPDPVLHFVEQCSAPDASEANTVKEVTRVVNDAVHSKPGASESDVADILRGVLRNVSMDSEDFESAVTSLLRTISSTSSSDSPQGTLSAPSPTADGGGSSSSAQQAAHDKEPAISGTSFAAAFSALNVNAQEFNPGSIASSSIAPCPAVLHQAGNGTVEPGHGCAASGADHFAQGWHHHHAGPQHWAQGYAHANTTDNGGDYDGLYHQDDTAADYSHYGDENKEQGGHGWGPDSYGYEDNDQWTHEAEWYANGWQAGTPAYQGTSDTYEDAYYMEYEDTEGQMLDPFGGVQPAAAGQHGPQDSWAELDHGGHEGVHANLDQGAAVGVLQQQFPAYSQMALGELLAISQGNLTATLDMLAQLEMDSQTSMPPDDCAGAEPPEIDQRDLVVDEDNFPALGSQASTPPHRAAWSSPPKLDITQKPASLRQSNQAVSRPKADSSAKGVPHGRRSSEHLQQQTTDRGQAESPAVPWVETGKAVGSLYKKHREDARDHARLRNAFFEQATQAFLAGDKALAKELGGKGRWHGQQMQAAHAEASEAIFTQRNAGSKPGISASFKGQGKNSSLLDLHGLHVAEAQAILKRELVPLKSQAGRKPSKIHILVGTGHHTKGLRTPARLPQAVQKFLQENNITYKEPQQGLLEVLL